jgi:AraC-like DNA-binding protein
MKEVLFDDFVPKINYHVFRKCNPDWRLRPHFVDDNDITYIIKGKARYTINGKICELGPGDLICLTDGTEKEAVTYAHNLMHCFSVNFTSLYPSSKCMPPVFQAVSRIGLRKDIIDLFRELTISWSGQNDGYKMNTRALLMLILHRLSEILIYNVDSQTGDYRINKAARTIALHYSDKLTVKDLAGQVRLNEAYFGRLFKQETGMTVNQYLMRIRVRNAENMLQTGNYKVHEVAEHCGFSDVVHFYKSFRDLRGFPPSRCIPKGGGLDIKSL